MNEYTAVTILNKSMLGFLDSIELKVTLETHYLISLFSGKKIETREVKVTQQS